MYNIYFYIFTFFELLQFILHLKVAPGDEEHFGFEVEVDSGIQAIKSLVLVKCSYL